MKSELGQIEENYAKRKNLARGENPIKSKLRKSGPQAEKPLLVKRNKT
ncbi:hypothetical protein [Synechocystis salina]|nr:hypothetical protein [Synechocystis salina]